MVLTDARATVMFKAATFAFLLRTNGPSKGFSDQMRSDCSFLLLDETLQTTKSWYYSSAV